MYVFVCVRVVSIFVSVCEYVCLCLFVQVGLSVVAYVSIFGCVCLFSFVSVSFGVCVCKCV